MTSTPVEELAETLVELADTVAAEFDLDDFLRMLANRCVRLVGADAAGLLLIDHDGQLQAVGASGEHAESLERCELRDDAGPGLDCCRGGEPVVVPDLTVAVTRWPGFAEETLAAGFTAVHAMPMRWRAQVIGALTLFRAEPGELEKVDARVAQAMADIATIGISQARAVRQQEELAGQLQHALDSRVVIEQAKGVLAERMGLGMAAAFEALRTYARSHNTRVTELAVSVVDGQFDTSRLRR